MVRRHVSVGTSKDKVCIDFDTSGSIDHTKMIFQQKNILLLYEKFNYLQVHAEAEPEGGRRPR